MSDFELVMDLFDNKGYDIMPNPWGVADFFVSDGVASVLATMRPDPDEDNMTDIYIIPSDPDYDGWYVSFSEGHPEEEESEILYMLEEALKAQKAYEERKD